MELHFILVGDGEFSQLEFICLYLCLLFYFLIYTVSSTVNSLGHVIPVEAVQYFETSNPFSS